MQEEKQNVSLAEAFHKAMQPQTEDENYKDAMSHGLWSIDEASALIGGLTPEIVHHFNIFFHFNHINDPNSKCLNSIQHVQHRIQREFKLDHCSLLDEIHQQEIYQIFYELMEMKNASDCTLNLTKSYQDKLNEIFCSY